MKGSLFNLIQSYVKGFESYKPPSFYWAKGELQSQLPFPLRSERFLRWQLFKAGLYQNLGEAGVDKLLLGLYTCYRDDLFQISKFPSAELHSTLNQFSQYQTWSLWPKVPGILRSISDFFLIHGSLKEMIRTHSSLSILENFLCEEIFYFGKKSVNRFKARYFLYCLLKILPDTLESHPSISLWPHTEGFWRFHHKFNPSKSFTQVSPEEILGYVNRLYQKWDPSGKGNAFIAFHQFLQRGGDQGYNCQKQFLLCTTCPLAEICPGSLHKAPNASFSPRILRKKS